MRPLNKFVCTLGVALCVAPIFTSAWAQQSGARSTQSNLLLEVQQLRAEIAQLRDMVERQQYQLKKMQGASSPVTNRYPGSASSAPAQNYPSDPTQNYSSEAGQSPQQAYPSSAPALDSIPSNAGNSAYPVQQQTQYPGQAASNLPASATPDQVVGGVVIEERTIGGPGVAPYAANAGSIPPVEERSVGARQADTAVVFGQNPANAVVADSRFQPIQSGTAAIPNDQNDRQAISSGFPAAPRAIPNASPSVIAVPSANASLGAATVVGAGATSAIVNRPAGSEQAARAAELPSAAAPIPAATSTEQPSRLSETSYYQQGFELLKQEKHDQAVAMFKQQIENYPQGGFADDAHYWIAESMYVNRLLNDSKKYFRAIIDNFQQSPRLPDAMLKTAYIEQGQGNVMEARILLQGIVQYHPRSDAAIAAKNRLADLN